MNTTFEIPPRPPWSPVPPPTHGEGRIEPPIVPVEPQWEYREVVREVGAGPMSTEELNALGAQHWELAGVVSAGERIHFYFKRERRR
jgi:hypothetical protein